MRHIPPLTGSGQPSLADSKTRRRRRGGGPAPPEAPRVDAVEPRAAVRGEEVHAAVGPDARHAVGRPGRAGGREAVHGVAHGEGGHRRRAALACGQPRARLCRLDWVTGAAVGGTLSKLGNG